MDETTNRLKKFNQADYLGGGNNPASVGGACHMFSLAWLGEIVNDKSQGTESRIQAMITKAPEIRMKYKAFSDRWSAEGGDRADEGMAKTYNVKIANLSKYARAELVIDEVRQHNRTGFVYSFWFGATSAHSIAVYQSGSGRWYSGHIYVFEPNFGEYKMGKSFWAKWLMGFLYTFYTKSFGPIHAHQVRQVEKYAAPAVRFGRNVLNL